MAVRESLIGGTRDWARARLSGAYLLCYVFASYWLVIGLAGVPEAYAAAGVEVRGGTAAIFWMVGVARTWGGAVVLGLVGAGGLVLVNQGKVVSFYRRREWVLTIFWAAITLMLFVLVVWVFVPGAALAAAQARAAAPCVR